MKLVLVLWCLAPVEYNGSDVVFQYVLLPVHQGVQIIAEETSAIGLPLLVKSKEGIEDLMEFAADEVIYPLLAMLVNSTSTVVSAVLSFFSMSYAFIGEITHIWFQKMLPPINCAIAIIQHIAIHILEYLLTGLEITVELVGKTPGFATNCFYSCLDLAVAFSNGSYDFGVAAVHKIAELSIFSFEKLVEFFINAFELFMDLSMLTRETAISSFEDGVSYYKNNQENPRLFSQVFKQILYQ